jgi:flagellar protein FlbD
VIFVTRLDGKKIVINAEIIEIIEETPETIVTMTSGRKVTVKEKIDEVVSKVIAYKQEIGLPLIKKQENS